MQQKHNLYCLFGAYSLFIQQTCCCRVCVGIQVPPDSNDWFCRVCISKRQDILVGGDKKKKTDRRKKKTGAS